MKEYNCPRCGYTTNLLPNFKKHLARKIICKPEIADISLDDLKNLLNQYSQSSLMAFKCPGCQKEYKSKSGLHYHKNACKLVKSSMLNEIKEYIDNAVNQLMTKPSITQNIYNTQNNIFVLNDFGHENTSYLSSDFIEKCILNMNRGMTNLIKEIHFNPEHPENNNIKLNSKKHALLEKRVDGDWHIIDKSMLLDDLVKNGHKLIHTYYINNDEFKQKVDTNYNAITDWMKDLLMKTPEVVHPLKRELFALLLNNRMMVFERV